RTAARPPPSSPAPADRARSRFPPARWLRRSPTSAVPPPPPHSSAPRTPSAPCSPRPWSGRRQAPRRRPREGSSGQRPRSPAPWSADRSQDPDAWLTPSRTRTSGGLAMAQHVLAQHPVHRSLVLRLPALEPGDHVGVQTDGHRLLLRPVELATHGSGPVPDLRHVAQVNLL